MIFEKTTLDRIYRYALSLENDSESAYDLMQTSIERYLRSESQRDPSQPLSRPLSYVFRIVRNAFIDQRRREKNYHVGALEDLDGEVNDNIFSAEFQSLDDILINKEEVAIMLDTLPSQHRELLFLWAVEGYTVQEIAELMEVPKGTLLSRLHRIRLKFQKDGGTQGEVRREAS